MQSAWSHFRNAQLYAFCAGAPVLTWARENEADFLTYCKRNTVSGKELETLVVELMLAEDGDGEAISRERRAEYGNCIGWFADDELCPETDPDKAVALAQGKGRITGIAKEYRRRRTPRTRRLRPQSKRDRPRKLDAVLQPPRGNKPRQERPSRKPWHRPRNRKLRPASRNS